MNFDKAKEILELSDNFTPEQIKQNYHRLSLKFHPDKGGNPEDFVQLTEAYSFITQEQTPETTKTNTINLNDIFRTFISPNLNKFKFFTKESSFFGFKKEISVCVSPKEFLEGSVKEIEQSYKKQCGCEPQFCDKCRGFSLHCNKCNGSGILFCGKCVNGFITHTKKMKIEIPKNSLKSISLENSIICIELEKGKKKNYFVKDDKLYYRYPISLKESLVGFEKTFKDPFGVYHTIKSDNIIKQNDGYFILQNLFLLFDIIYPVKLSKSVMKQLKQIEF